MVSKTERNERIIAAVAAGEKYRAIGEREGITKARVQQIAKRAGVVRRPRVNVIGRVEDVQFIESQAARDLHEWALGVVEADE